MWRFAVIAMPASALLAACGEGGLSDQEEFAKLAERHREATFTVMYEVTWGSPTTGEVTTTRQTWYQDGQTSRTEAGGMFGTSTIVASDDGSYRCSSFSNPRTTEPGPPACIVVLYTSALGLVQNDSPLLFNRTAIHRPEEVVATRVAGRKVAGEITTCFSIDHMRSRVSVTEVCFDDEGRILFAELERQDDLPGVRHTAIAVSDEVPEGIFEPPYEVVGESELCDVLEC